MELSSAAAIPGRAPPTLSSKHRADPPPPEIISRGFLQTATERVLTGKYRSFMAVLTSSVLFAVLHLIG
ncbi:MAG TPA: hypothetical protein DCZ95_09210 [Verrucomicrobia bacterium]|nr:hypothetical protein [Verrucomicrobiota bacterium]